MIALRAELLRLKHDSNKGDRRYDAGFLDSETENITVNAYQAAINFWATKHVRLTAEYFALSIPRPPTSSVSRTDDYRRRAAR